jgi:hypothetical protein
MKSLLRTCFAAVKNPGIGAAIAGAIFGAAVAGELTSGGANLSNYKITRLYSMYICSGETNIF